MKAALQVASPPAKPLLIFDGDCNFCTLWVRRWQQGLREQVEAVALQDARVATQFPELDRPRLEAALHLVEPDGQVFRGAEAVFRTLSHDPRERWLSDWYAHSPGFARASERVYGFVARHRRLFSGLTWLAWGRELGPASQEWVRCLFLRGVGLVYLVAFVSLWVQVVGLMGAKGILPARLTMAAVTQQADATQLGWERYHVFPTWCWVDGSDACLKAQCAAGTVLAALVLAGVAPAPCLFLLWLIYLSLATVGREFLGFQWDNLLLETGFLAIFLAPWQWRPRVGRTPPASRLMVWLVRWLVFRLMFESGCVKWLSGDPTWRQLTALNFHYETQPLPTWIGWYAHQGPWWFQKTCTGLMFGIELVFPFFIFGPRRLRHWACAAFVLLQLLILATGNYGFFNLLTICLCLLLLDDAAVRRWLPARWRGEPEATTAAPTPSRLRCPRWVTVVLACVTLTVSVMELSAMFGLRHPWPRPMAQLARWLAPFRSFNNYGLFAVMTTTRPEIVVEGSQDGETWLAYGFKYKPGEVKRRPGFVEPHMPRLDWQMWFAALGDYRQNPWFVNFCVRLLQGSPETLALLEHNPFPQAPPRYIRAVRYDYRFTDFATRRATGAWWRREKTGDYLPVLSLRAVEPSPEEKAP